MENSGEFEIATKILSAEYKESVYVLFVFSSLVYGLVIQKIPENTSDSSQEVFIHGYNIGYSEPSVAYNLMLLFMETYIFGPKKSRIFYSQIFWGAYKGPINDIESTEGTGAGMSEVLAMWNKQDSFLDVFDTLAKGLFSLFKEENSLSQESDIEDDPELPKDMLIINSKVAMQSHSFRVKNSVFAVTVSASFVAVGDAL
ncbi:hypothetical protein AYI69_g5678 [Smittium culicis]|uniref:Uncharacterized protein n=1 Tax=Smittium culicis TaxID=133412 RepID=A0A1R1Y4L2_9FUNG|nr:hypothetical protein AYI69_g5678 [Smittium culicis]